MSYGTVSHFENSATVRFERQLAAPIDDVWAALTDADELAGWLAPCTFDARLGGAVRIDFGEGAQVDGEVTIYDPPHRLEYTWTFTNEPDSILLFELEVVDTGTRLALEHRLLPSEQATGYGAGWHAHLDMLSAQVTGTEPVDWDERFNEVLGSYAGA
ncbi:MAG: SRPBCC family protein [Acidimicrobiia bacterium]|nr:SRPBCC family protein [Acidimicrobiia bacterium]